MKARQPHLGTISRICRVGERCIRLIEPTARSGQYAFAVWRVEVLDRDGTLLDHAEVPSWARAREIYDAFVGGAA
jgi:hypothetical protein